MALPRVAPGALLIAGLVACQPPAAAPDAQSVAEQNASNASITPPQLVDPASPAAAIQAARTYYALIDAKRFAEADALMPAGRGGSELELGQFVQLRTQLGAPGAIEGAAGSLYITIPATIAATRADGTTAQLAEQVTLRRVNDVPGATEAQRRWHIESIERLPATP